MVQIYASPSFNKDFGKLPARLQKLTKKHLRLFQNNPRYPSLNTEKIEPKSLELWTLRVDRGYRVLFIFTTSDSVRLLHVDTHDNIYRKLR